MDPSPHTPTVIYTATTSTSPTPPTGNCSTAETGRWEMKGKVRNEGGGGSGGGGGGAMSGRWWKCKVEVWERALTL